MENNEVKEVVYTKARLSRRLFGHFFDLSIFFLSTAIIFSISNMLVRRSGWYKAKENELIQLRNESGLYEDDTEITKLAADDEKYPSYEAKKNFLSTHLNHFYHNPTYFGNLTAWEEYGQRRLDAKSGDIHLFIKDSNDNIVENNIGLDEALYNFYSSEVSEHALAYLTINPQYFNLTRFSFWVVVVEIIVLATLMFTLFYLIFPLFVFKRGRQTIGMKLEKIGLINVHAVNVTSGIYCLRFLFMYVVFLLLDFVGFLIPAFVSVGMMHGTKTNSSLANYVFNDYMVDVTNQEICLDELEREFKEEERKKISLENRDLTLK